MLSFRIAWAQFVARSRLADESQGLARPDLKVNVVHRVHNVNRLPREAVADAKVDGNVFDLKELHDVPFRVVPTCSEDPMAGDTVMV